MSLSGIRSVDSVMLRRVMRDCIVNGRNLIVFGPAGSGKTEIALNTIHETKIPNSSLTYNHVYLNLSVCTPPELVGLPQIEDGVSSYALPRYMPTEKTTENKVVMLVDELDKADTDLQNPMLETFQFRSINGTKLMVQSVIATANLPDEGAFSKPLSSALANRCQMVRLEVNSEKWVDWAGSVGTNPLISAYILKNGSALSKRTFKEDATAYCQASPRSWTMAAKALDSVGRITTDNMEYAILQVASYVGDQNATSFAVYIEYAIKFEPLVDEIVNKGVATPPKQADEMFVVSTMALNRLTSWMTNNRSSHDKKETREKAAEMFKRVYGWLNKEKIPREIILGAVRSNVQVKDYSDFDLIRLKEVQEMYNSFNVKQ